MPEAPAPPPAAPRPPLGRNVLAVSAVSLLTDVSSEMIYPLLPAFLSGVLGAGAAAIGLVEGAAETTATVFKFLGGRWSDRTGRRKPFVLAGYALAAAARPLVAVARTWPFVLAVRVTDRVGKGIRTSPRDALIADSVDPSIRGRAYGFHRAADHAGAALGPMIAFLLLGAGGLDLRTVFWLAAVPGILAVIVLAAFVRDRPGAAAAAPASPPAARPPAAPLPPAFRRFLFVVGLFTLGCSTDAFLLLRARDLGITLALIPVLWAVHHLVKSVSSTPGGILSDRVGRGPLIVGGWLLYALVYAGFAAATAAWHAWALFAVYGVFYGLTEGAEKALVADLVPADARGTAFGWYNLAVGAAALPASVLFGLLWDRFGPAAAFSTGAALALLASAGLLLLVPAPRRA